MLAQGSFDTPGGSMYTVAQSESYVDEQYEESLGGDDMKSFKNAREASASAAQSDINDSSKVI